MRKIETEFDQVKMVANAEAEAYKEQDLALHNIFPTLNLANRAEVVSLAKRLQESEISNKYYRQILNSFEKLNDKGKEIALRYLEALAATPKYRKQ